MIDIVDDTSRPIVTTIVESTEMIIIEEHEWNNEEMIAIRKRAIEKVFPRNKIRMHLLCLLMSSC